MTKQSPTRRLRGTLALVLVVNIVACVSTETRSAIDDLSQRTQRLTQSNEPAGDDRAAVDVGSLSSLVKTAVAADPRLRAMLAEVRGTLALAQADGALPDAELKAEVWGAPLFAPADLSRTDTLMIGPRQGFPALGADLDARVRSRVADADVAFENARRRAVDVAFEVTRAAVEVTTADVHVRLHDEHAAFLKELLVVQTQQVAAGSAGTEEVLDTSVELAEIHVARARYAGQRQQARVALNALLGVGGDDEVVVNLGSPPVAVGDGDALVKDLSARHPNVRGASAAIKKAAAERAVAEADATLPTLMVGADYWWMPGEAGLDQHAYGVMASISLPWLNGRHTHEVDAAEAMEARATLENTAVGREVARDVRTAQARLATARTALAALNDDIAPLAQRAVDANVVAYRGGRGSLLAVLRSAERLLDVKMNRATGEADVWLAAADVAHAAGTALVPLGELGQRRTS